MRVPDIPKRFIFALDLAALVVSFYFAGWLWAPVRAELIARPEWSEWLKPTLEVDQRPLTEHAGVLLLIVPGTLITLHALGGYRSVVKMSRSRVVGSALVAPFIGLSLVALVLFGLRSDRWSRLLLFLSAAVSAVLMSGIRLSLRAYRRSRARNGMYASNVIAVGVPAAVAAMADYYKHHVAPTSARLVGRLSIGAQDDEPADHPLPRLGAVDELGDLLVHRPIHEVIAVLPSAEGSAWVRKVAETCDYFQVTLRIIPEALLGAQWKDLDVAFRSDTSRFPEIVLRPRYVTSEALFVKRLIDVIVSAALLALLSPLFLLIAILIKLTTPKLPIFYRWNVVGYKGQPFTGYKFTTMGEDADQQKAVLMHLNEMSGPVFKIKADPRITPLGRLLRKFSLNELPQLWSVLKGDMSLVGPRPAGPHELVGYELWHKRKLSVRPGITCLWQVRGRNLISSFDDWVRMDLEYIDRWSLWLDFKILVRTAWVVVRGTGS